MTSGSVVTFGLIASPVTLNINSTLGVNTINGAKSANSLTIAGISISNSHITLGGDVTGNHDSNTVIKIQGVAV